MGKIKSLFQINGTIDGMNFYVVNGQQYVRKAGGGFNGKKIKSDPSMVKVRQNGQEFGMVSRLSKTFRITTASLFPPSYSGGLHNRLVKLFTGVKNMDFVSERGQRTLAKGLENSESTSLVVGFSIPEEAPQGATLYEHVDFDFVRSLLTIRPSFGASVYLMKKVKAVSVSVGVIRLDAEALAFELIMGESILVSDLAQFPSTLNAPVPGEKSRNELVFVVLQQYEEYQSVLQPLQLKQSVYFEVVAVR